MLEVRGEVDAYTAPQLREALREMDGQEARLLVDLNGVDFMDSSGLGVLIGGQKRAREQQGELALVCSGQSLLRLLAITGLDPGLHDPRLRRGRLLNAARPLG